MTYKLQNRALDSLNVLCYFASSKRDEATVYLCEKELFKRQFLNECFRGLLTRCQISAKKMKMIFWLKGEMVFVFVLRGFGLGTNVNDTSEIFNFGQQLTCFWASLVGHWVFTMDSNFKGQNLILGPLWEFWVLHAPTAITRLLCGL